MTERGLPIADGAAACPFVAFEDERDERSSVPDHRHRCYAETPPAPRAIAHQEAYCLSSAFPVCPVFQDWARREAARTRGSAPAGTGAAAAAAGAAGAAVGGAAGVLAANAGASAADDRDGPEDVAASTLGLDAPAAESAARLAARRGSTSDGTDDAPSDHEDSAPERGAARPGTEPDTVRRNPPRDWAAPPPWLASAEGPVGGDRDAEPPAFLGRRTQEPGQGLAGSAADRLAGGQRPSWRPGDAERWSSATDADAARSAAIAGAAAAAGAGLAAGAGATAGGAGAAAGGAGAAAGGAGSDAAARGRGVVEPPPDDAAPWDEDDAAPPQRRIGRRPRAYAQHLGGPDGPDWERPRRYEAYPTIRTRVGMPHVPRLALMAGAIVVLAIALFLLPGILNIGGSGPGAPRPSAPAPSASRAPSHAPTVPPAPTPAVYTIKKGDTLSKIAAKNGLTLEELLAANPDIKNPNKVGEGQQIIIPTPSGGPNDGGGASAGPS